MKLTNWILGKAVEGTGPGEILRDPVTSEELASASTEGLDLGAALEYSRRQGGAALRALSYGERAALLNKIAETLSVHRRGYGEIALRNSGNTETDAAMDIDGAIGTLKYYARLGSKLGDARMLRDGDLVRMGKDAAFQALHIAVPMRGVAIHINAFNFPAWGLWEKAAVSLLAGLPVFSKPATATAWLAQRMVEDVVEAGVLPEGALSIICGSARDLLDHVASQDVIAFTGSAGTAQRIRGHRSVIERSVRVNIEADSLNSTLLGPDVAPGSPEFDLFVREVVREMTIKAGQKCTAIRRVLVPAAASDAVAEAIRAKLAQVAVGNPRNKDVRMGPLVSKSQQSTALEGIATLRRETRVVFDGGPDFAPRDANPGASAFVPPTLLACDDPAGAQAVHEVEVFGPVSTLLPYGSVDQAYAMVRRGQGSLVASLFSADPAFIEQTAVELAESHGRVLAVDASVGEVQTGHGNAMPMCIHGGPGRSGGGSELGGMRGLRFYHQTTALQGPAERLRALAARAGVFQD